MEVIKQKEEMLLSNSSEEEMKVKRESEQVYN